MRVYVIKRNDCKYLDNNCVWDNKLINAWLFNSQNGAFAISKGITDEGKCKVVPIEIREVQETIKLLPCICGSKYRQLWTTIDNSYYYKCSKCCLQTANAKTKAKLKEIWNELIQEKMKENK